MYIWKFCSFEVAVTTIPRSNLRLTCARNLLFMNPRVPLPTWFSYKSHKHFIDWKMLEYFESWILIALETLVRNTLAAEMFGVVDFWLKTRIIVTISSHPWNPSIYNIICWFAGPMGQTTCRQHLMFQVLIFFHKILQNSLQKPFHFHFFINSQKLKREVLSALSL